MLSFNQELKDEIVAEIIRHREQDQIIQGTYGIGEGDEWKGCAVGCAIRSLNMRKGKNFNTSNHKVYEDQFGIPVILAKLEDRIFEGLSVEDSKTWPENFMSAIPANTDLSLVWPKFAVWLLTDKEVVQKVSDLYFELIEGGVVTIEEWILARNAAVDAYVDTAASAAAYAHVAYAQNLHYKKMAYKLIEILKETK